MRIEATPETFYLEEGSVLLTNHRKLLGTGTPACANLDDSLYDQLRPIKKQANGLTKMKVLQVLLNQIQRNYFLTVKTHLQKMQNSCFLPMMLCVALSELSILLNFELNFVAIRFEHFVFLPQLLF